MPSLDHMGLATSSGIRALKHGMAAVAGAPVVDGGAVLGAREGRAPDVLHLRALQRHAHRRLLAVPLLERHLRTMISCACQEQAGGSALDITYKTQLSDSRTLRVVYPVPTV